MISRRALIPRLALLTTAGAGLWLVRDRLPWLGPNITFADGKVTPWLPLVGRGVLLEVDATLNGAPVRALIDSGAQVSAVDSGLAARLALPRTTALPFLAYGVTGGPKVTHTVRLDLALPGLTITNLRAASLDLAGLADASGREFDILVGRDILSKVVLDVDPATHRVRLTSPTAYALPRGAVSIPLRMRQGAPHIVVIIEGAPTVEALVDTGAHSILALTTAAARETGLLAAGREQTETPSIGLGGVVVNRRARARSVRIAGLDLGETEVLIYRPGKQTPAPAGLIGSGFLRRYRYALDLPARRLILAPPTLQMISRRPAAATVEPPD